MPVTSTPTTAATPLAPAAQKTGWLPLCVPLFVYLVSRILIDVLELGLSGAVAAAILLLGFYLCWHTRGERKVSTRRYLVIVLSLASFGALLGRGADLLVAFMKD